jgi:hypothetical protein
MAFVIGLMTEISAEREYIRDEKITKMVIVELTDARYIFILIFIMYAPAISCYHFCLNVYCY